MLKHIVFFDARNKEPWKTHTHPTVWVMGCHVQPQNSLLPMALNKHK